MEEIDGDGDIAEEENGDQPKGSSESGGLFVGDPSPESEEGKIGIEESGDEPRVSDHGAGHFPEWHEVARPSGYAEHSDEYEDGEDAKEPNHWG